MLTAGCYYNNLEVYMYDALRSLWKVCQTIKALAFYFT